jgi:hypothetical protein
MKPEVESALKRLGGILLSLISLGVTQCNANNAKDREIALEKLHRKQNFVDTFASKIDQYLNFTLAFVKDRSFYTNGRTRQGARRFAILTEEHSRKREPNGRKIRASGMNIHPALL